MKKITISVIIPVYNTEEYIEECLESVFCQLDSSIEVIIVNDGSVDNSYAICQNVINRWKLQSIRLLSQENQGLSAARNIGMSVACGEYILFLDSDDMLAEGTLVKLNQYISKFRDVDLFFYDAEIKNEIREAVSETRYSRLKSVDSIVVSGKEYFAKYYLFPVIVSSCMCLFRTDFLNYNNFKFEPGRLHEDVFFSFKTVLTAETVLYIPEALYVRRYRPDSITTVKKSSKHIQDHVYAYEQCARFAEKNCSDNKISNSLYYFMYSALFYFTNMHLKENEDKKIVERFYNDIICFYCKLSKTKKSFTFYKGLLNLLDYGEDNRFIVNDRNIKYLMDALDLNAGSEIRKYLEETVNSFYHAIFSGIPFQNEKLTVGIYGSGKHSRQLIEEYQKKNGEIEAKILFIDSQKKSFTQQYLNRDIVNIADAEKYVDVIVISSFVYHLELKNLCKQYVLKKSIDIIDFYEEERMPLF